GVRVRAIQIGGHAIELGLSRRDRNPILQPSEGAGEKVDRAARFAKWRRAVAGRRPDFRVAGDAPAWMMKPGWRDADDREEVVVEANLSPEHRGGATEAARPPAVADHGSLRDARVIVLGFEHAPELRIDAENLEEVHAHQLRLDPLRLVGARQGHVDRAQTRRRAESKRA